MRKSPQQNEEQQKTTSMQPKLKQAAICREQVENNTSVVNPVSVPSKGMY